MLNDPSNCMRPLQGLSGGHTVLCLKNHRSGHRAASDEGSPNPISKIGSHQKLLVSARHGGGPEQDLAFLFSQCYLKSGPFQSTLKP